MPDAYMPTAAPDAARWPGTNGSSPTKRPRQCNAAVQQPEALQCADRRGSPMLCDCAGNMQAPSAHDAGSMPLGTCSRAPPSLPQARTPAPIILVPASSHDGKLRRRALQHADESDCNRSSPAELANAAGHHAADGQQTASLPREHAAEVQECTQAIVQPEQQAAQAPQQPARRSSECQAGPCVEQTQQGSADAGHPNREAGVASNAQHAAVGNQAASWHNGTAPMCVQAATRTSTAGRCLGPQTCAGAEPRLA